MDSPNDSYKMDLASPPLLAPKMLFGTGRVKERSSAPLAALPVALRPF